MILKLPTSIALSLLFVIVLAATATAQQKRQTPARSQPPPAATPTPTPPPTFDTLLAANSYKIYAEVRSVGQLVRSNSINEILEPILKLSGPPKEFRTVVKWLNAHADEVVSSRMLVAVSPTAKEVPNSLFAIEFASAEEATRFKQLINDFLKIVVPPRIATPAAETNKTEPPPPPYHLQQAGSLILITATPLNVQKLRPAGSKLMTEEVNFRVARNRFNTESIFIFVDTAEIEKEEEEQRKKYEETHKQTVAARTPNDEEEIEKLRAEAQKTTEENRSAEPSVPEQYTIVGPVAQLGTAPPATQAVEPQPSPFMIFMSLGMALSMFSYEEATWPQAVAVGISLEGDSFDVRALLVNKPGEKNNPIPFLPMLAPGPAIVPEAPSVLPADTEMLVTLSLDLPQMYAAIAKPQPLLDRRGPEIKAEEVGEIEPPLVALEKQLKIKIKDDLLPLLGSEIVLSVPVTGIEWFQPPPPPPSSSPAPTASPSPSPSPSPNASTPEESKPKRNIAIAISLRDKEGMRALLPKLIEALAFKGASSFAQTERREDTELVSYANVVSYAFIGNFLIISPEVATTRHIVDSYLKRQTLSGDPHFKNYTRWQPRQLQGQIYISPVLMESYRTWIQQPTTPVDEQTRAFLTRFSVVPQAVTYSLSNEGFGPLHELHLPKNLVLLLIAGAVGMNSPPPEPATPANPY